MVPCATGRTHFAAVAFLVSKFSACASSSLYLKAVWRLSGAPFSSAADASMQVCNRFQVRGRAKRGYCINVPIFEILQRPGGGCIPAGWTSNSYRLGLSCSCGLTQLILSCTSTPPSHWAHWHSQPSLPSVQIVALYFREFGYSRRVPYLRTPCLRDSHCGESVGVSRHLFVDQVRAYP